MTGCTRWKDIRAEHVERAGGEAAVVEGKRELSLRCSGIGWPRSAGAGG